MALLESIGAATQPLLGRMAPLLSPFRPALGKVVFPKGTRPQTPTSTSLLERDLQSLQAKKMEWARMDMDKKADLFKLCAETAGEAVEEGAELLTNAKGSYGHGAGEERIMLMSPIQGFREYAETLSAQAVPKPKRMYKRKNGQYIADVFPTGPEAVMFAGFKGELWIQPGKEPTQASKLRSSKSDGSVALVLGAGNQISVAMYDVMHTLITENSVAILKMNPILDYLRPYVEKVFSPLIDAGYVKIAYGGVEQGTYLTDSPAVDLIHLTGSAATYDKIVWKGKPKTGEPALKKPVTAELGCVTPYIITPGNWSQEAIRYHADECVAGLTNNAGHNCCKLEILVTPKDWSQRKEFMSAVRKRLSELNCKVAWYPGSAEKHSAFKKKFPQAEELGSKIAGATRPDGYLSWAVVEDLSPEEADLSTENWCGVLQEVTLPGSERDVEAYLSKAVDFANNKCWGSLSCTLIAPPETDSEVLDTAVADLKYGSIAINLPSFTVFGFPRLSWGAFPGHTPQDIQSGMGAVHNTLLYDYPEKSVLYAPWLHYPTHLWSPSIRNLDKISYTIAKVTAKPDFATMNQLLFESLRA